VNAPEIHSDLTGDPELKDIVTYYLEMNSLDAFSEVEDCHGLSVIEAELDNFRLNKFLYQYVGEPWQWMDRLDLSDEEWADYVNNPRLRTWVAYLRGSIAGYFELSAADSGDVEIAYFGLAPDFIGRGFGGYLLSQAIRNAWRFPGAKRVWVHTCTLDHPSALNNYLARGFTIYRQESSQSPTAG
jgi:GNAT superfamily N-acetyltransferase